MFCYKCGNDLRNDAQYCPHCGAYQKIDATQPISKHIDMIPNTVNEGKLKIQSKLKSLGYIIATMVIMVFYGLLGKFILSDATLSYLYPSVISGICLAIITYIILVRNEVLVVRKSFIRMACAAVFGGAVIAGVLCSFAVFVVFIIVAYFISKNNPSI